MFTKPSSIFLGVVLLGAGAFGQSQIGGAALNGSVTDASSAMVVAAKVTVIQPSTGFTRTVESSPEGIYSLSSLPAGDYTLTVEKTGFKIAKYTDINLTVGAVATFDVALQVGSVSDTVSVTAEVPVVETTRSQVSTTVDNRAVSELPINGRNFLDFTLLTPGVVRDPTRGGDLSFAGQRGTANSLQVDG